MEASKVRETEVNKMMSEVGKVITSHLNNLVDRFEENTKKMISTVEILKELPIIKDLETRIENLKAENIKLKDTIQELKSRDKKHIILKTEEINSDEDIVSYSEIDALVTNQVEDKAIGEGSYMEYMANQSDTDTSDDEDDSNEKRIEVVHSEWVHTANQGTLLGSVSSNDEIGKSAETLRDESEVVERVDDEVDEGVDDEDDEEEDEDEEEEEEVDDEEDEDDEEEEEVEVDEEVDDEVDDEEEVDEVDDEEEVDEVDEEDDEVDDEDEEDEEVDDVSVETDGDLMVQLKKKMIEERMKLDEGADDDGLVSENDEEEEKEVEDQVEDEDEVDEELEVEEIEIKGVTFYCTDENNGILFEYGEDGEIGDEIGYLKKGSVFFS